MVSAYIITLPSAFRAARPIVCISDVAERRNPSLSASSMATRPTSGRSSPSRRRFMPTRTSNSPRRRSRIISIRSIVSISECMYRTRMPMPSRYSVSISAIRFVRVVTSTLSPLAAVFFISPSRSSTCPSTLRTSISGSNSPVGRITCSATWLARLSSYSPGVADTHMS